ncbi:homocysteine S-methyltransferase family protein [Sphingomicrobium astaxanthinifaciens]|uniref:homocysteine S-methyltransferase family protein n=1 Tax=Sphingomicrobium astaxanthinifaciens TaxID=1227949 RepID=UPI001FCBD1B7|nr:homocysteine S-methyltransferase family protein [Sphingomicrobium astaxanthinifaciens]MCJ7421687.1 homocysteine S-methyltransferase family protein [Sphingomicrobium astaxanthinifaciens]
MSKAAELRALAKERVLVKDGAYGTAIQRLGLGEAQFRGAVALTREQRGNNDLLNLTQPDAVEAICAAYAEAGAHVLATNSFNANAISQADYGAEALVHDINVEGAAIVRRVADRFAADGMPRFVAGAVGPTNKTLSLSPDVADPGYREVGFEEVVRVYEEQVRSLAEGGVDFILIETIFDTLNAKAGIMAVRNVERALGRELPIMLSMTLTDLSGRNLSGHTVEALWASVRHAAPLTIGLNCSFGAEALRPHLKVLSARADTLVMAYPNAGLPNDLGDYDEGPGETRAQVDDWLAEGLVNIVGGCCGTTPEHIAAIAKAVEGVAPRRLADPPEAMLLAGLEPLEVRA